MSCSARLYDLDKIQMVKVPGHMIHKIGAIGVTILIKSCSEGTQNIPLIPIAVASQTC
jgi:hypothetical protein